MRAVAITVLLLIATSASAEIIDRIVAVVGGQIVTQSDVDTAVAFGLASNLQELIDRTLMLNEVRRVSPPAKNRSLAGRSSTVCVIDCPSGVTVTIVRGNPVANPSRAPNTATARWPGSRR